MEVLQTIHIIHVEDLLSHGIEHADLRGLTQFNGEVTVGGIGVK